MEEDVTASHAEDHDDGGEAEEPPAKKPRWVPKDRGPPPHAGQKEIPEGKPNCLLGLTFVCDNDNDDMSLLFSSLVCLCVSICVLLSVCLIC